ncbi:carbohydrate-binding protein [Gilvimarinus polysaccharolyticus]|uniref:carbohydrate-binding protein n=1 Tax=Gilvimarinus polysaccharolyticus TaxID=863921 RepID=UPI000A016EF0|nr:carbohydrate-binding protein [Gilvimarinus polysaccharolyticus]
MLRTYFRPIRQPHSLFLVALLSAGLYGCGGSGTSGGSSSSVQSQQSSSSSLTVSSASSSSSEGVASSFSSSSSRQSSSSSDATGVDWADLPVPADAGAGNTWELVDALSDDFNYSAPGDGKSQVFYERWSEGFINAWQGPGLTDYHDPNSSVVDGNLVIEATRKPNSDEVYTGAIHSKASVRYPVYVETRVKIMDQVLANAVWMLSSDSTEEIDIVEAYGSSRSDQAWFAERMHLSHHVFIRDPFQDYQPKDDASWYVDGRLWRDQFSRVGIYWRDPWHLEYYIDGELVRTVSGEEIIDPKGYTNGAGLSKDMQIIVDAEDQGWRSDNGIKASDEELSDPDKNRFYVDWIRVYKPASTTPGDSDNTASETGISVTTDFGAFFATGKEGDTVVEDTVDGFNAADGNITHNTLGDWGEYTINIPEDGDYRLEIDVASPTESGLAANIMIDDTDVGQIAISTTGSWEVYDTFSLDTPVTLTAGTHTLRVQSAGIATWQWNGDVIRFLQLSE